MTEVVLKSPLFAKVSLNLLFYFSSRLIERAVTITNSKNLLIIYSLVNVSILNINRSVCNSKYIFEILNKEKSSTFISISVLQLFYNTLITIKYTTVLKNIL